MKVSTLLTTLCVLGVASSADPTSQCDNGPVQCCATVGLPTDSAVSPLLGLLGVVVPDMSTQVGLTCMSRDSPLHLRKLISHLFKAILLSRVDLAQATPFAVQEM